MVSPEGLLDVNMTCVEKEKARLIVPLQKEAADATPYYIIPGLGGHVISFQLISKMLSDKWFGNGVLYPGFLNDDSEPPTPTIEAIAERMVKDLVLSGAREPILLVGYSMGGFICLEVARVLKAKGFCVGIVFADVKIFNHAPHKPRYKTLPVKLFWMAREYLVHLLGHNKAKERRKIEQRRIIQGQASKKALPLAFDKVIKESRAAMDKYELSRCEVPSVLIRCERLEWYDTLREWPADYGWGLYTNLETVLYTKGDHLGMLKGPNVKSFVTTLEDALSELREACIKSHQDK